MAIIQYLMGIMRGSVAGNTYSHNKGGHYVRERSTPTNPNSERQQEVRSILGNLSAAYAALSTADQDTWKTWAADHPRTNPLGGSYVLSPHQAFVSVNARLSDAGLTLLDEAPAALAPTELVGPTVTISTATGISVAFTGSAPSGSVLVVWASNPISGAADPNIDQARLVGYSAADPTTPAAMTLPFSVQSGQSVNFWCSFMSDEGLVAVPEKDRATRA